MPSVSGPQNRLMEMVAHDPAAAKRLHIPQSVGKEFAEADKGKKFSNGGAADASRIAKHLAVGGSYGYGYGDGGEAYGLVQSTIPGRTDRHNVDLPSGSYVIPADVMSGLGEGNTLSGAALMDKFMSTGPWGTKLPQGARGQTIPRPPSGYQSAEGNYQLHNMAANFGGGPATGAGYAKGGAAEHHKVPAVIAGGEFVLPPAMIAHHPGLGNLPMDDHDPEHFKKALKRGHEILDAFVGHARKSTIKTMSKLPGPVK